MKNWILSFYSKNGFAGVIELLDISHEDADKAMMQVKNLPTIVQVDLDEQ